MAAGGCNIGKARMAEKPLLWGLLPADKIYLAIIYFSNYLTIYLFLWRQPKCME
jgi:hypothetical protein